MLAWIIAAGITGRQARAAQPGENLLTELLTATAPDAKTTRLQVAVLSVPMKEAALAMVEDVGAVPQFWTTRLEQWQAGGALTKVADLTAMLDGRGTNFQGGSRGTHHSLLQQDVAHYWDEVIGARAAHQPEPDMLDSLLQDMHTEDVGTYFNGTLSLRGIGRQAVLTIDLHVAGESEKRPLTTWPLPHLEVPRMMYRPWHLKTRALAPVGAPFLLGAQMEPPHDGQVHTGHVLMAFGCIRNTASENANADEKEPGSDPRLKLQSWTLSLSPSEFVAWISLRASPVDDDATLKRWLGMVGKGNAVELLATAAVALIPGDRNPSDWSSDGGNSLRSDLHWENGRGFEPSSNPAAFRVLPESGDTFFLRHALTGNVNFVRAAEGQPPVVFRDGINGPPRAEVRLDITLERPAAATRWLKWKSAMERDDNDPAAMEMPEADAWRSAESTVTTLRLLTDKAAMVSACLTGGRVHVSFARVVTEGAPLVVSQRWESMPTPTSTVWVIDTPVVWQSRLLHDGNALAEGLAGELFTAVAEGRACLAGLTSIAQEQGVEAKASATRPVLLFEGYVHVIPHAHGIFFNPRYATSVSVGDAPSIEMVAADPGSPAGGTGAMDLKLESRGTPEWRQRGIWQPAVKATNAGNSGIRLPVFPLTTMQGVVRMEWRKPRIVAAMRLAPMENGGEARLRWYVARMDGTQPPGEANETLPGQADRQLSLQAIVLRVLREGDKPMQAEALLKQAREGTCEVLDLMLLPGADHMLPGAYGVKGTAGWEHHFLNGREHREGESWEDNFRAPAVMPPGTHFDEQIRLDHHVTGLALQVEANQWKLVRDAGPPQMVTDSFADAQVSWPITQDTDFKKMPKITINVQRPIFTVQEAEGKLPELGQTLVKRLAGDTVLILKMDK